MKTLQAANLLDEMHAADLARFGMTPDKFNQLAWNTGLVNGRIYAIPLDTHPFVCFYNTDVCKKAGLLDRDGMLKNMDGPDTLVSAMEAAKKVTGEWGGVISINADTATQWRFFSSLYWQLVGSGSDVLADDGTEVSMDDARAEQVLSYIADLTKGKELMPSSVDYPGAVTAFATGKAGFYFEGDWEVSTFLTAKTPFSMTRLPNVFGGDYACQADSHSFVLPKDDKRDDAKRKAVLQFIRSLLDQSKTWAEGGHIPAWLPFQRSAEYRKIKPQSDYADVANSVRYDPSGWYSGSGALDGVPRMLVWRDGTQPLVVLVGKPWQDILRLWHTEAARIGAIMVALILFVLAVTLYLAGEIGRRAHAEDKLEELATTDALTGLRNRRKFDAEIETEWQRAARHKIPIALLMIDADHFKSYNDSFGHQAGDQVLVGIAICISDSVRRASDCAARYGGEEFAVLLPGLSPAQALGIAETIRLKFQGWSDGPTVATLSIGVASMIPSTSTDWAVLLKAADNALYAAKANGRNLCVLASIPKLSLVA